MIASSAERVLSQTDADINKRIRRETDRSIAYFAEHPYEIDQRLSELDEEWDIERALATGSSCLSLFGLTMSIFRGRRWMLMPLVVQGFYLQHALQGWCPPLPVFRRLGFRTPDEINRERYALLALRGNGGAARQSEASTDETIANPT